MMERIFILLLLIGCIIGMYVCLYIIWHMIKSVIKENAMLDKIKVHVLEVNDINDTVEELTTEILSPLHDMILDGSKKVRITVEITDV